MIIKHPCTLVLVNRGVRQIPSFLCSCITPYVLTMNGFHFLPDQTVALHYIYMCLGAFMALFGLVSLFVKERLYLTESLVATIFGFLLSKNCLNAFDPQSWWGGKTSSTIAMSGGDSFHFVFGEIARMVICFQVMAAGIGTPGGFLARNKISVAMMLGPVMLLMWGISGVIIKFCMGWCWKYAFIVAACVTPTDPVLAMSVIKGKFADRYIPSRLRNLLAVESGANDGLGFPFMMLPIMLIKFADQGTGTALLHWTVSTWLWEILFSMFLGIVCGWTAKALFKLSIIHKLLDKESFLAFSLALTLFVTGLTAVLGSDDLLAVYMAGNAFAWEDDGQFVDKHDESHINSVLDMIFNIGFFVLFGLVIPWESYLTSKLGWRLLVAAILILLFRRLPVVMALRRWIPALQTRKEAFFAGWFGPMGVGAIFFSIIATTDLRRHIMHLESHHETTSASLDSDALQSLKDFVELIYPTVSFIVLSSILIHGITVPLTNSQLKRRMRRKKRKEANSATEKARRASSGSTVINKTATLLPDGAIVRGERLTSVGVALYNDETVQYGMMSSPSSTSDTDLASPIDGVARHSRHDDEYVYVTDDEDEDMMSSTDHHHHGRTVDTTFSTAAISPSEIVIFPANGGSTSNEDTVIRSAPSVRQRPESASSSNNSAAARLQSVFVPLSESPANNEDSSDSRQNFNE